jgi:hypothetical protein
METSTLHTDPFSTLPNPRDAILASLNAQIKLSEDFLSDCIREMPNNVAQHDYYRGQITGFIIARRTVTDLLHVIN